MGSYYGWHGSGMGFGWLILLVIVVAVFYFLKTDKQENISAKDILDKRYANGEIGTEEYLDKLKILEQSKKEN